MAQKVKLCAVNGCCPTVTVNPNMVVIEDDFGGKVQLTKDQWNDLKQKAARNEL